MKFEKEYPIRISPEILELLGPSLYTNIYYVLAELIANSYDADAENVWIDLSGDSIIIEDDGQGMTYDETLNRYLEVAKTTRVSEIDAKSKKFHRPKMGRKGIGKLAALAVSTEVNVKTKSNGELSGFVLTRNVPKDGKLRPILESEITFSNISESGTRIEMLNSEFKLPATTITVKNNLAKFFPQLSSNPKNPFVLHIKGKDGINKKLDNFVDSLATSLDSLLLLGEDKYAILDKFEKTAPKYAKNNLKKEPPRTLSYNINNNQGEQVNRKLKIEGWIGTYHTTRGLKAKESSDFPDNFLAIYSNGKLGQFNILNEIGQNRLNEVYVVGQLYVDEFEETNLPDMALSNRQGYKTDDIRFQIFLAEAKKLLTQVLQLKEKAIKAKNKNSEKSKKEKKIKEEELLSKKVETSIEYMEKVIQTQSFNKKDAEKIFTDLGIKKIAADQDSRKILISHTRSDQLLNNILYGLLLLNGFSSDEIIYTSDPSYNSVVPYGLDVFEYLREFFIKSYSKKEIYVLYVYSDSSSKRPGVLQEIGAGWVVKTKHGIIKAGKTNPEPPLNISITYPSIYLDKEDNRAYTTENHFRVLYALIDSICSMFNKEIRSFEENRNYFENNNGAIIDESSFDCKINNREIML